MNHTYVAHTWKCSLCDDNEPRSFPCKHALEQLINARQERDQLRAEIEAWRETSDAQERSLESYRQELFALKNPSDGRCMSIAAFRDEVTRLRAERDLAQSIALEQQARYGEACAHEAKLEAELRKRDEALAVMREALEELRLGHEHNPEAGSQHYRPLGDSYGYCCVCSAKVGLNEDTARDALAAVDKLMEGEK